MLPNDVLCRFSSVYSLYLMSVCGLPFIVPHTVTSRSACAYGSGRSSTALTTLNIAVLAPMPIASVRMATIAKPGRRVQVRMA